MTNACLLQLRHLLFQHELEAERLESNTLADEMLAHGLDPVQTQRVQHGTSTLHDDKNGDDALHAGHTEGVGQSHGPQHNRELLVSE
jgi:hypothetical protein